MDSGDLKLFEAVARLGRMSRAAEELHTVQSNVTARIRILEEQLGTRLFERHSRGVKLTSAGRRLLPYATDVGRLLEEARRAARDDGQPTGPLTIGTLETTMAMRLSPVLAAYAAAYPDVDLTLRTGTTAELVEAVLSERLEGAYVCGPVEHPELDLEPVFHEELVVLTSPSVPSIEHLVRRGDVKIVVLRAGCSYRHMLGSILARRGILGLRCLEFGTWESIFSCVAAGIGVTLVPMSMVGPVLAAGRASAHQLPRTEAFAETVFIRKRSTYCSSALRAFLELARPKVAQLHAAE
jgi:LysR family transcriptional regulator, cell division regulator